MNKEQQDKLWNELSEESKSKIQQDYNTLQMGLSTGLLEDEYLAEQIGKIKELEELFGSHNLNLKLLTYEYVARELFSEDKGNTVFYPDQYGEISESDVGLADDLTNDPTNCTSRQQAEKLLAINKLLNVAKYLNGDWKPDWENGCEYKWYIEDFENEINIDYIINCNSRIVYFRTKELAQQAIQILGEETIRLALTTDY